MTDAGNPATRAGVIGLGAMGQQMARHMVAKGFGVAGYDIDVDAMRRASELGVKTRLSPAQVGEHAEVVVVMVATDRQVEEVIAQSGLLDRLDRGSVICIASSCAPDTCRRMEEAAAARGIGVLDCPVVLGQEAAKNGTVTCYVGGDERWLARAGRCWRRSARRCCISARWGQARSRKPSTTCCCGRAWWPISSA